MFFSCGGCKRATEALLQDINEEYACERTGPRLGLKMEAVQCERE